MGHRIISTLYDDVKMQQVFGDKEAADIYEFCGVREGGGYVPAPSAKKRKLEEEEEEAEPEKGDAYLVHRQSIFNISMCKLNRYRQIPDPSLRRSVLICNTLRTIESEMVSEGMEVDTVGTSSFLPSIQTDNITTLDPLPPADYPAHPPPVPSCPDPAGDMDYERRLTDLDSASGRATPYPEPEYRRPPDDATSGWEERKEEGPRGTSSISWSSVLNFSSQSDLDATNNNGTDDVWNCEGGGTAGAGGPNTSPSASSDSGISTASDEIFGDIDLSLYDFDLLPLSPPNVTRLVPPSAEELLRAFSNQPGPP